MSLGRLLTAGKSLVGLESANNPYRMRGRYLLPKFGGGKNPFSDPNAAPAAMAAPRQPEPAEPTRVSSFQLSPAELAAARLKDTARLPVPSALPRDPQVAPGRRPRRWTMPVAKLWNRALSFNPVARWWNRKPASKPAVPRFDKAAVQGELSLDNVRVVRNDLNEADVEIVPAKLTVQPKPEKPRRDAKPQETAELIGS
jgi:hypothetical protein